LDADEDFAAGGVGAAGREAGFGSPEDGAGVVVDGDGDVKIVSAGADEGAVVTDCVG